MQDKYMVCMAALITVCYVTYVAVTRADGVLFGSVMLAIGALAGVKFGQSTEKAKADAERHELTEID